MLTHYFTLQSLAHEFNERLHNAIIRQIFTQQRNELLISCSVDDNAWTLSTSCNPRLNYVFLRDSVARAKKNSVDLFDDAVSLHVLGVTVHPFDRILQIQLENDSAFCFQLFGPTANILLVDREMVIVDAFKRKRELVGQTFEVERKEDPLRAMTSPDAFEEALRKQGAKNIFAALKIAIPGMGSTLAREALHRSRTDEKTPLKNVSSDEVREIQKGVHQVLDEVGSPHPTLYYRGDIPRLFSLIPLQHFTGSRAEEFSSVNDAVRTFVVQTFRTQVVDAEKNLLLSKIKTAIDRLQRSLTAIQAELQHTSRAEEYDRIAKIIMANLQHLTKGTKAIDLPDIFAGEKSTHIALDPKLTPAQNAERYFGKAKSARHAHGETERRAEAVKKDIALLEKMQLHLDSCSTKEQLKEFRDDYNDDLLRLKLTKPKSGGEEIPFRVFTVVGGFQVWAGKNSENNDLLTMKHTRPNDLWFHARGGSGSHIVLKVGTSSGNPSKVAIQEAASIAAYYSKMRKAKMVPVAYCERKYVKKPKGASAGTVTLQREKVVFAEPALPVGTG
jgi:predicted ribosome quality control (RQC) complex YloA/Tae2 family protein